MSTTNAASSESQPAKILIVDDHPVVRDGLAMRIARCPDLVVCGEASDVAEAIQVAIATQPDVMVIDISLKSGNGIDLIKRIRARHLPSRMLAWSMHNEFLYAERALRAGAMGYISKEHATEHIIAAIRCVLEGKLYLSDKMADRLLHRTLGHTEPPTEQSPLELLSDRELEVFNLIGQGMDTQQVAERMRLSPKTVETYRARIKTKLNLQNGVELIRCALHWCLDGG